MMKRNSADLMTELPSSWAGRPRWRSFARHIAAACALVVVVGAAVIIARGGAAEDIARDAQELKWADNVTIGAIALQAELREGIVIAQTVALGLSDPADSDALVGRLRQATSRLAAVAMGGITGTGEIRELVENVQQSSTAVRAALVAGDIESAVTLTYDELTPTLNTLIAEASEVGDARSRHIVAVSQGMGTVITAARYVSVLVIPALVLFVFYRTMKRNQHVALLKRDLNRERELRHKKETFVAAASHHIRTPLSAVVGFSEMLRDGEPPGELREEIVQLLAAEARETAYIVDDLLVAARHDLTDLHLNEDEVDLRQVVEAATSGWIGRDGVTIVGDATTVADSRWLVHAIRNLLRNADAFGGKEVKVEIRQAPRHVSIEVSDNGGPLPPGEIEKIFELYYSYQPDEGLLPSLGLGLSAARRIARAMGGDLRYDRIDHRNVFGLTIPQAADLLEAVKTTA